MRRIHMRSAYVTRARVPTETYRQLWTLRSLTTNDARESSTMGNGETDNAMLAWGAIVSVYMTYALATAHPPHRTERCGYKSPCQLHRTEHAPDHTPRSDARSTARAPTSARKVIASGWYSQRERATIPEVRHGCIGHPMRLMGTHTPHITTVRGQASRRL